MCVEQADRHLFPEEAPERAGELIGIAGGVDA